MGGGRLIYLWGKGGEDELGFPERGGSAVAFIYTGQQDELIGGVAVWLLTPTQVQSPLSVS